jgi:hypothetical protein
MIRRPTTGITITTMTEATMGILNLPVVVDVLKPDGSSERVRIGTARRDGAVFVLELAALNLARGLTPPRIPPVLFPSSSTVPPRAPATTTSATPPPFLPTTVSTLEELEGIAARARKTLADATKVRWHRQEAELLSRVEEELSRLR